MNQLIFIRRNLYSLKKDYGKPIDIYTKSVILSYETGKQIVTKNKIRIRKAIVLPSIESFRGKQVYERAFLTGNPTYGSSFEVQDRIVIIDQRDLPKGFTIATDDYVIIDPSSHHAARYEVKTITDYEFDTGIILGLKTAKGGQLFQIIDQYMRDKLQLQHETIGEL